MKYRKNNTVLLSINIFGIDINSKIFIYILFALIIVLAIIIFFCIFYLCYKVIKSVFHLFFMFIRNLKRDFQPHQQQTYSLFLDYIFPYSLLISTIWPFFLNIPLFHKFMILFLYHCCIISPFIVFWDKTRNWENIYIIYKFKNPKIIRCVVIGLIYPYIHILFLGMLRYIALGQLQTSIFPFFTLDVCLILLFFIFYIIFTFIYISKKYKIYKEFLLEHTNLCLYSLHLYLLRNKKYKNVMEFLDRMSFYIGQMTFIKSLVNEKRKIKYPLFYKITNYIWIDNPNIVLLFIPLFVFIEYLIKGHLFYSYYVIFIFFCFRVIIGGFHKFALRGSSIMSDCCHSDYLAENWSNPYYPRDFVTHCLNPHVFFNFNVIKVIPKQFLNYYEEINKQPLRGSVYNSYSKLKKFYTIRLLQRNLTYFQTLKLDYSIRSGSRWTRFVHTSSTATSGLHPGIAFLGNSIPFRLGLISKPTDWVLLMPILQKLEKTQSAVILPKLYSSALPFSIMHQKPLSTAIISQIEFNTLTRFSLLQSLGIDVSLHKETYQYINGIKQLCPDLALLHPLLGAIGLDLKVFPKGSGSNTLVALSREDYEKLLKYFIINQPKPLSPEHYSSIMKLNDILDVNERILYFGEHIPLFASIGRFPPLNLGTMVSSDFFSPEGKEVYKQILVNIGLLNELCYQNFPLANIKNYTTLAIELQKNPQVFKVSQETLELVTILK